MSAQQPPVSLPDAPSSALTAQPYLPDFRSSVWDDYYTASLTCSSGVSHTQASNQPLTACGAAVGFTFLWFEVGAFTPQATQSGPTGYWTVDAVLSLGPWHFVPRASPPKLRRVLPLATVGYTRIFQTANALDFSVGTDVALDSAHSLRFELKDYLSFNGVTQNNAVFRVSFVGWVEDP